MGKAIGALMIGYLVIGGLIFVIQLAMPKISEPTCFGRVKHVLTDRYFPPRDDLDALVKTRTGKKDITDSSWILRVGLQAVQWLPDLYREVITGAMPASDYLRGGYKCHPIVDVPSRRIRPITMTPGSTSVLQVRYEIP